MRTVLLCMSLAIAISPGFGQQSPIVISVAPAPKGGAMLTLQNASTVELTAFVVTWVARDADSRGKPQTLARRLIRDTATNPVQPAVKPGQSAIVPVGLPGGSIPVSNVPAALFDDGAAIGDPQWIQLLRQRRTAFLDALTAVIGRVDEAIMRQETMQDLLNVLAADFEIKRAATQAALGEDLKAAPAGSMAHAVDPSSTEMKVANMKIFLDEERRQAIESVYASLLSTLKRTAADDGSPLSDRLRTIRAYLEARHERLVRATQ